MNTFTLVACFQHELHTGPYFMTFAPRLIYLFKHSLMLHWFADLMNVTEEVTIHRPWGPLGLIN